MAMGLLQFLSSVIHLCMVQTAIQESLNSFFNWTFPSPGESLESKCLWVL